jgi:hypothetical protein
MAVIFLAIIALWLLSKVPDFGGLITDVPFLAIIALLCLFIVVRLLALLTGC